MLAAPTTPVLAIAAPAGPPPAAFFAALVVYIIVILVAAPQAQQPQTFNPSALRRPRSSATRPAGPTSI